VLAEGELAAGDPVERAGGEVRGIVAAEGLNTGGVLEAADVRSAMGMMWIYPINGRSGQKVLA